MAAKTESGFRRRFAAFVTSSCVGAMFTIVVVNDSLADSIYTPAVTIYQGVYPMAPWITKTPDDTLVTVFREGHRHGYSDDGKVMLSTSTDNGQTWSTATTIIDAPLIDDRNTAIIAFSNTDWMVAYNIYTAGGVSEARTVRTTDAGLTWSVPQAVENVAEWDTRTRAAPITLSSSGELILPYMKMNPRQPLAGHSTDGGQTWTTVSIPTPPDIGGNEWSVVEMPDHSLAGIIRAYGPTNRGHFYVTKSTDEGRTWSTAQLTNLYDSVAPSPAQIFLHDGRPYVVYADERFVSVVIATTDDPDLLSWNVVKKAYQYRTDGKSVNDGGYPSVVPVGDDRLFIVDYMIDASTGTNVINGYTVSIPEPSTIINEDAKLLPSEAVFDDYGFDVDIRGNTAIVGANGSNHGDNGAAYIYQNDGAGNWSEVVKLIPPESGCRFGNSTAISGDTVVVCGNFATVNDQTKAGAAWVFERNTGGANNWGQVAKLVASDAAAGDNFGQDCAIDGDTIVVGASKADTAFTDSGAAYVFKRNQGGENNWGQVSKLVIADPLGTNEQLGFSIGISGNTVAAGAIGKSQTYVYEDDGAGNWSQVATLSGTSGMGTGASIDGDTIVVGARLAESNTGKAYFFSRDEGGEDAWGKVAELTASDYEAGAQFGYFCDVSGDYALIGAPYRDSNGIADSGAVYLFRKVLTGEWVESGIIMLPSDLAAGERFGIRLALDGEMVVITTQPNTTAPGAAYAFTIPELPDIKPGDANGDGFVDAMDAALLADNWLTTSGATWVMGDFNSDGVVDDRDATLLAINWSAGSASVPEPVIFVLLCSAVLPLLMIRRRSQ